MTYSAEEIIEFINQSDKGMPETKIKKIQKFFNNNYYKSLFSKTIAYFLFRSSDVMEELHTKYKISDEDMKILNKDIANKTAGLFEMIRLGSWKKSLIL